MFEARMLAESPQGLSVSGGGAQGPGACWGGEGEPAEAGGGCRAQGEKVAPGAEQNQQYGGSKGTTRCGHVEVIHDLDKDSVVVSDTADKWPWEP